MPDMMTSLLHFQIILKVLPIQVNPIDLTIAVTMILISVLAEKAHMEEMEEEIASNQEDPLQLQEML